jgi:hypothetical protein
MIDISPAVVKNLRGVVYHEKGMDVSEHTKYLKKAFKYRALGIHESLAEDLGRPFISLRCPFRIRKPKGVDRVAFESLVLALFYVSPLIILGAESAEKLEPFKIFVIKTKTQEDGRTRKLHLRVCDYSVIDWYPKLVELGKNGELQKRLKFVKEDAEKRFWRLKPYEGKDRIAYYDLLGHIKDPPHEALYNVVTGYILEL